MDADALLNAYVKREIVNGTIDHINGFPLAHRELQKVREHFQQCAELTVRSAQGENGAYGCDTGCEYARLTAEALCPHFPGPYDVDYGWFGEIADIYDALDELRAQLEGGAC